MTRLASLIICATLTPIAQAQTNISWYTIDAGGAMSSVGGTFAIAGTIGQPDAQTAPVMTGGSYVLTGGFWPISNTCFCLGDMNHDGKKDGGDIQLFVSCVLASGDCSCADVDGLNGVTLPDTDAFITDLLIGNTCP